MKKPRGKLSALGFASWLVNSRGKAVTLFEVLVVLGRGKNGRKQALQRRLKDQETRGQEK